MKRESQMAGDNNLSMESFGVQERANSKIYTDSNASMGPDNIHSGSNK